MQSETRFCERARTGLRCLSMSLSLALGGLLGALTGANAQTLTWLGTLGGSISRAYGVSADGGIVVGVAADSNGHEYAFRWTPATGMQMLSGLPGGRYTEARAISADGTAIAGRAENASFAWRAVRWSPAVQDLGTLGWFTSEARAISANGAVVVGDAPNSTGIYDRAFRWQNNVMQDLGTLGGNRSYARGVSADGSVIAGHSELTSGWGLAYRWTQATGMQELGKLRTGPGGNSYANGISADGTTVVGWSDTDNHSRQRGFRWTAQTGMRDLGQLPVNYTFDHPLAVSGNGQVVVGWMFGTVFAAFRWTEQTGIQDLNQAYASLLGNGSWLTRATAISPDGRFIAGIGYNAATGNPEEAFLLDTQGEPPIEGDVNGDGCVDDADLLIVLFNFGNAGGQGDANNDAIVDDADLLIVLFHFGQGC